MLRFPQTSPQQTTLQTQNNHHVITKQCLAYFVYNFVATLVLEPVQQQCFNAALERLRADPRITVRLGPSIVGYGQETANRSARAVIPHQVYRDALGREHVRVRSATGGG